MKIEEQMEISDTIIKQGKHLVDKVAENIVGYYNRILNPQDRDLIFEKLGGYNPDILFQPRKLVLNMKSGGWNINKIYQLEEHMIRRQFNQLINENDLIKNYPDLLSSGLLDNHMGVDNDYSYCSLADITTNYLRKISSISKNELDEIYEIKEDLVLLRDIYDQSILYLKGDIWKFTLIYPIFNMSLELPDNLKINDDVLLIKGTDENKNNLSETLNFSYFHNSDFQHLGWLIQCDSWFISEIEFRRPKNLTFGQIGRSMVSETIKGFVHPKYYEEIFYLLGYTAIRVDLFSQLDELITINPSIMKNRLGILGYNRILDHQQIGGFVSLPTKGKTMLLDEFTLNMLQNYPEFRVSPKKRKISLALNRFYNIHKYNDSEDVILDAVIAMESLVTSSTQDLTLQFALKISSLISETSQERKSFFKLLKELYHVRSKIVHQAGHNLRKELKYFSNINELAIFSHMTLRLLLLRLLYCEKSSITDQTNKLKDIGSELILNEPFSLKETDYSEQIRRQFLKTIDGNFG